MPDNLTQELALLPRLGVADLRSRYAESAAIHVLRRRRMER